MNDLAYVKHKVDLLDYDYADDIQRRLLLSDLDETEFEILEEIHF